MARKADPSVRNEVEFLLISQTPTAVSPFRRETRAKVSPKSRLSEFIEFSAGK